MNIEEETHYDFFISCACEDRDSFVHELALELIKRGFKVWYDEFALNIGNSLSLSIDKGIKNSTCGIVILSPYYFRKKRTTEELKYLLAKKNKTGQDIILPIWHNIKREEIYRYSPILAYLYAINSKIGLQTICDNLSNAIEKLKPKVFI